jgi:hypothetical protein
MSRREESCGVRRRRGIKSVGSNACIYVKPNMTTSKSIQSRNVGEDPPRNWLIQREEQPSLKAESDNSPRTLGAKGNPGSFHVNDKVLGEP